MDSFYEQPRKLSVQRPTQMDRNAILPKNTIPDASMLMQNQGNEPFKQSMTYNAWKLQCRNFNNVPMNEFPMFDKNKENQPSIIRKQVRFGSPQTSTPPFQMRSVETIRPTMLPPVLVNNPKVPTFNKVLQDKPFEKIYMANIPNRNLDLSVLEPSATPFSDRAEKTRELNENVFKSSANHFEATKNYFQNFQATKKPLSESTTIDKPIKDQDPSVRDLLKIIQQQNEQLMNLQKQVASLIEEKQERQMEKRQQQRFPEPVFKNKHLEPKFAIDVMTSFEVSIRGPPNKFGRRFQNDEAQITEISDNSDTSDTIGMSSMQNNLCSMQNNPCSMQNDSSSMQNDSRKHATDVSLTLNEPLLVRENCPSPEHSIHVDMKDYSSDEEMDNDVNKSQIGWTIYNNVMDQVNCLLKKSEGNQDNDRRGEKSDKLAGTVMKQVKEATLKHLKSIGVELCSNEDDDSVSSNCEYSPTQISFAVKQLLMKYLPDDELAKACSKKRFPNQLKRDDYPQNAITPRPDFSLASLQYMKKYNLLANHDQGAKNLGKKYASNKMLDITALKQQPKLL